MANFDKTKPAGSTKVRLSDDQIRDNWDALEDAISRDHKFPTGDGVDSGEHLQITFNAVLGADVDPGTGKFAIYPKDNGAGDPDLFCQDENDTVLKVFYGEGGTEMIFIRNSAPTGWTRVTTRQDNAMLCHAATGNIATGGGVNPQSTHTHTGPSHAHGLNSHTHTGPSHTHTFSSAHVHGLNSHTHTGPSHQHVLPFADDGNDLGFHSTPPTGTSGTMTVDKKTNSVGSSGSKNRILSYAGGTGATGAATGNTASGTASGTTVAGGTGATGAATGNTAAGGTDATGANTAPYFLETISCTRDT